MNRKLVILLLSAAIVLGLLTGRFLGLGGSLGVLAFILVMWYGIRRIRNVKKIRQ